MAATRPPSSTTAATAASLMRILRRRRIELNDMRWRSSRELDQLPALFGLAMMLLLNRVHAAIGFLDELLGFAAIGGKSSLAHAYRQNVFVADRAANL